MHKPYASSSKQFTLKMKIVQITSPTDQICFTCHAKQQPILSSSFGLEQLVRKGVNSCLGFNFGLPCGKGSSKPLCYILCAKLSIHVLHAFILGEGRVRHSLHDKGGGMTTSTSHILEVENTLLIGSYHARYLLKVSL